MSLDDSTFNLLNYWKVNDQRFPVVSNMAKRFLAVPASSLSSESTFSTRGRILDDYRSSLKPETVQALVCASSWIRASQNDNSVVCNVMIIFASLFVSSLLYKLFTLDCFDREKMEMMASK